MFVDFYIIMAFGGIHMNYTKTIVPIVSKMRDIFSILSRCSEITFLWSHTRPL